MKYKKEDIERAEAYLRERLDAEGLMQSAISTILEECAESLVDFFLGGATQEEIDMAIESLVDSILEWIDSIAISYHDRSDILLPWLHDAWNDGALADVVRKRANTFHDEIAVACAVGELLHRSKKEILDAVKNSMREPWQNPLIVEARKDVEESTLVVPDSLDLSERHYGKGIPISSLTGLETLSVSAVADTWTRWQWTMERDRGAKGYYVLRGSSYPCEECDSHTGVFFKIDDEDHLPQYHLNCRCYVVYSDVERV